MGLGFRGLTHYSTIATFAGTVTLTGDSLINAMAGDIRFTNGGSAAANTAYTLTLDGTSTGGYSQIGALTLVGGALIKQGSGSWKITSASTYTGGTTVTGGTLYAVANALSTGNINISSGGGIYLTGAQTVGAVKIGTGGGIISSSLITGQSLSATSFEVDSTETATLQAILTNPSGSTAALTKNGTGTLILGTSNTYTGSTNIINGTLQVSNDNVYGSINSGTAISISAGATLAFKNSTATTTLTNTISGAGTIANTYLGGNTTLDLSGAHLGTFTGTYAPYISMGTAVQYLAAIKLGTISDLTGMTFNLVTNSYATTVNGAPKAITWSPPTGSTTTGGGSLNLQVNGIATSSGVVGYGAKLTLNATDITIGAGAAGFFTGSINSANYTRTAPLFFLETSTTNYDLSGAVTANLLDGVKVTQSGVLSGSGSLALNGGTGTFLLNNAANTYSGNYTINSGILKLGSTAALGSGNTGTVTIANGAALDLAGYSLTTAKPLTLSGTGVSSGGALFNSSATAANYLGPITLAADTTIGGGTATGAVNLSNATSIAGGNHALTLGGNAGGSITSTLDTSISSLTKVATGNWALNGGNSTYSGSISINSGTLAIGAAGAIGNSGTISFGGGALKLFDTTDYSSRFSTAINQQYSFDTNGQNVTFASDLTSVGGSLKKAGTGTLTLSGNNQFTGVVNITAGALRAASNTALGTTAGGVTVASGATLEIGGSSNLLIGAEALTVADGGTIHNVAGDNQYLGLMTLSGNATVTVDTGTSLNFTATTPALNVLAGKRLTLNTNGNLTFGQDLTGGDSNSLYTKTGNGTLLMGSSSTLGTVINVYAGLYDPTGTDYSSQYGVAADYTVAFYTAASGGTKVSMLAGTDYSGTAVWTGTAPTLTSAAGTVSSLTYASGITISNTRYVYAGPTSATTWTVVPRPVTVTLTAPGSLYTYNGITTYASIASGLTAFTYTPMAAGNSITSLNYAVSGTGVAQAGNFTITPSMNIMVGTASNYIFAFTPLTVAVAKANNLAISAVASTSGNVYKGSAYTGTYTTTALGNDASSITVTGVATGTDAGTYSSSLFASGSVLNNYNTITITNANLVVSPKPITITNNAVSATYDATSTYAALVATAGYTPTALVGSDRIGLVTQTLTAVNASDIAQAGTFTSTPSAAMLSVGNASNYSFSYVSATNNTVAKANLNISAVASTTGNVYNGTAYTGTYTTTALGSDASSITVTGVATGANVGTYASSLAFTASGNVLSNYNTPTITNANLVISPRPVTLTGQMNYSGQPTLDTTQTGTSLSATNLVQNDSLTITGTATLAAAAAGTQAITAFNSLTLNNSNYTTTGASGSVNVIATGNINVAPLNNTEVAALIGSQLAGLTTSQIASFSTSQLQVFTWQQIASLSPSQFSGLTAAQLASLSTVQLQGLSAAQLSFMTPAQLAALTPSQMASLSTSQLQALSAAQVSALSAAQLSLLTPAQIALLTGNSATPLNLQQILTLTPAQIAGLSTVELARMTAADISAFSIAQLSALSADQLAALSPSSFALLSSAQIAALSMAQLNSLTPDQIRGFTTTQLSGLSPSQFAGLSTSQMQALTVIQVNAITTAQLSVLTPAQIALLMGNGGMSFTLPQLMALSPAQIAGLSAAQVASFSTDQLSVLSYAQLQALSIDQLAALTPASLAALSAEQIMALSTTQVASLTPDQLRGLRPSQIASLTAAELASFDALQLAAIGIFPKVETPVLAPVVVTAQAEPSTPVPAIEVVTPTPNEQEEKAKYEAPIPVLTEVASPRAPAVEVAVAAPAKPVVIEQPVTPNMTSIQATSAASAVVTSTQTGVLAVTVLTGADARPNTTGIAFEQDANSVSLRQTSAPPAAPVSATFVFNDRLTTFLVAQASGQLVEFQGGLINKRLVIVAPSAAAKQIARSDMNTVLAAAITSLGTENRVMLANLDGVVIDLR